MCETLGRLELCKRNSPFPTADLQVQPLNFGGYNWMEFDVDCSMLASRNPLSPMKKKFHSNTQMLMFVWGLGPGPVAIHFESSLN